MQKNKAILSLCSSSDCGCGSSFGRYTVQFIEAMEFCHVQGPKYNTKVVSDYLRADGPFECKNDYFNPDPKV
jgi:hypothetical protein